MDPALKMTLQGPPPSEGKEKKGREKKKKRKA